MVRPANFFSMKAALPEVMPLAAAPSTWTKKDSPKGEPKLRVNATGLCAPGNVAAGRTHDTHN